MKYKTTKRDVLAGHAHTIAASYCALQTLLRCEAESAYTTRREGWGADVYSFGSVAIVTGYAPFGNIRAGHDLCKKYETAAQGIAYNYDLTWSEQKNALRALIDDFLKEAIDQ